MRKTSDHKDLESIDTKFRNPVGNESDFDSEITNRQKTHVIAKRKKQPNLFEVEKTDLEYLKNEPTSLELEIQLTILEHENAALKVNALELTSTLTKYLRKPTRPLVDYFKYKTAKKISKILKPFSKSLSLKYIKSSLKRDPKRFQPTPTPYDANSHQKINPLPYSEPRDRGELIKPTEPTEPEWINLELKGGIVSSNPLVDVIVPVYKGYAETLRCIYSVLTHRQETPFRLIVINDKSPTIELSNKLLELEKRGLIKLFLNDENLGFVKTCNIGIQLNPTRDVVLLNSDTEVYGNWLDRLYSQAYKPNIGTVTPLSNNATIASYPNFITDNTKQLELDHKLIDEIVSRHLKNKSVITPTGIGFCLFIRRNCINIIGLLDPINFGRGYGEENDFCVRAENSGFINLIAADVYVTHWGSSSFGEEKQHLLKNAIKRMKKMHPNYFKSVDNFIKKDPLLPYRKEIDIQRLKYRANRNKKGVILFVTHTRGGGTEVHTNFLAQKLEEQGTAVLYLKPHPIHNNRVFIFDKQCGPLPNMPLLDLIHNRDELIYFIKEIGVTHIHIHHTIDMNISAPILIRNIAFALDISYDFTAHDYFSICPRINLIDHSGFYCGEPDPTTCNNCIKHDASLSLGTDISSWRNQYYYLLKHARKAFTPDIDAANRLQKYFPDVKFTVRPHEFHLNKKNRNASIPRNKRRRIGLIGALGSNKGSALIAPVAKAALKLGLDMDFIIIGYTNRDSELKSLSNVKINGKYAEDSVQEIIASEELHLAWFPSICPETFCYTLSEAIHAGVYPVAFDLGAPARRIRDCGWGSIMDIKLFAEPSEIALFLYSTEITARPECLFNTHENTRYENILSDYYGLQSKR